MICSACGKKIEHGKIISCDGDFVCDDNCHKEFHRRMDALCAMTDDQFERWLKGEGDGITTQS